MPQLDSDTRPTRSSGTAIQQQATQYNTFLTENSACTTVEGGHEHTPTKAVHRIMQATNAPLAQDNPETKHSEATGNSDVAQQKFLAQNTSKHTTSLKTQSVAVFVPTKQKQVTNCNKQAHQQGEATNVPQNEAHSVQHRVP